MAQYPPEIAKIIQKQEDDIDQLLIETVGRFRSEIVKRDWDNVSTKSKLILTIFAANLLNTIVNTNNDLVVNALLIQKAELAELVKKSNVKDRVVISKFQKEIDNYISDFNVKTRKIASKTMPFRIKTLRDGSIKTVRNIIAIDLEIGKSAYQIAKDIEQYIRPEGLLTRVSPLEWYRQRFESYKVKDIKDIPKGSVSYNAFTIARSESNRTYRDAIVESTKNTPWVYGYKWNLSASHPKPDICDVWANSDFGMGAGVYTAQSLPYDHPNGLCFVTTVQISSREFKRYLDDGVKPDAPKFKGEVPDLKDWGVAVKGTKPKEAIKKLIK